MLEDKRENQKALGIESWLIFLIMDMTSCRAPTSTDVIEASRSSLCNFSSFSSFLFFFMWTAVERTGLSDFDSHQ